MTEPRAAVEGSLPVRESHGDANQPAAGQHSQPGREADPSMTFPQVARLELDELLAQLVDRAQEVMNTQGRLRGLLAATQAISSDLSLPVLLRRIVESACDLVGAQYGALGVIGRGGLQQFITVGVSQDVADTIGHRPQGRGLLGLLIAEPHALRLADLHEHPASVGFPVGHPPMRSFLGAPVRVRGKAYGNIYLAEKLDGAPFSSDDEELLVTLAAAAGVAIDNARLFEASQQRQRWLEAAAELSGRVLSGADAPLDRIAEAARRVGDADLATVLVPIPGDPTSLRVAAAEGVGAVEIVGQQVPRSQSLAGLALSEGRDIVADEEEVRARTWLPEVMPHGPALAVRLSAGGHARIGVLTLRRGENRDEFSATELEMAAAFAGYASLAVQLNESDRQSRRLLLLEDRERIARDLHDLVIQRLFAAGLSAQGLAMRSPDDETATRLGKLTDDLDETVRIIRGAIFELRPASHEASGLRVQAIEVVRRVADALGFEPDLRFHGPVDSLTDAEVGADLIAVLQEALSNVARHAHASRADVTISADSDQIRLAVADDGAGMGESTRRSGLNNMRERADARGGSMAVGPGPQGTGTVLSWAVPTWQST
jgi:signal transduction histidine kinase